MEPQAATQIGYETKTWNWFLFDNQNGWGLT